MELEIAKRILKDEDCMWNNSEKNVLEAISTVLRALENSIPQEKVLTKTQELNDWANDSNIVQNCNRNI